MKSFTYECVTLEDVCKHNKLDYAEIIQAVCDSDVSFGNNADTLMTRSMVQDIVDDCYEDISVQLDWAGFDDRILISLGS
jgi:hypothetical protein